MDNPEIAPSKTKINQAKTQHNMCWTPLYANKHISVRIENEIVSKHFLQLTNYNSSTHLSKLKKSILIIRSQYQEMVIVINVKLSLIIHILLRQ